MSAPGSPSDAPGQFGVSLLWAGLLASHAVGCSQVGPQAQPSLPIGPVTVEPMDEAAFLFDQTQLRTYEILIDPADLAFLDDDPAAEEYVPATLVFEGVGYGPVGLRYKGQSGAWVLCTEESTPENPLAFGGAKTCSKLNMKVSFHWQDPDGRFFGLKKLLFHAMNLDPSMMRERLGYKLLRDMHVPAPRAVHAKVLINGMLSGVYTVVEEIDGRFTRARFDDGEGNLYKEVWPTAGAYQVPVTEARARAALQTNEDDNPSVVGFISFGEQLTRASSDSLRGHMTQGMDVPTTMRMVAVDRTIRHDDGPFHFYCGLSVCANHNYFFYEEPSDNKLWLLPWDLDIAFNHSSTTELSVDSYSAILDDWDELDVQCRPKSGGHPAAPDHLPPSCDPLVRALTLFEDEYALAVGELLAGPFEDETVERQLDAWSSQIASVVQEAHDLDPRNLSLEEWQAELDELRLRAALLRDAAAAKL